MPHPLDELLATDTALIPAPMYNVTAPAALSAVAAPEPAEPGGVR
jgi:FMN-dependent NADH-azoreductase